MFPRASRTFVELNAGLSSRQPEPDIRPAVVRKAPGKAKSDARPFVSIIMFRVRLLDKDNAYGATKPITDSLCKVGLLPGDSEDEIRLKVDQEKVAHRREQRTQIRIVYP